MSEVSPVSFNGKDNSASPLEVAAEPAVADEPITAFYGILHCAVAALSALGGSVSTPVVAYSEALLTAAFRAVISSVAEVFHNLEIEHAVLQQQLHERDRAVDDLADRFAALCCALDAHAPIGQLPFRVQMEFETFAERLGLPRPWRTATVPNPRSP